MTGNCWDGRPWLKSKLQLETVNKWQPGKHFLTATPQLRTALVAGATSSKVLFVDMCRYTWFLQTILSIFWPDHPASQLISSLSFSGSVPFTWKPLPVYIRCIEKLSTFKHQLKSHAFQSAMPSNHPMPAPHIRFKIFVFLQNNICTKDS